MALTGPVEAPVTFNAIYEVDDLVKFLTKIQLDLDTRFDVINGMIKCIELNECGHIKFDNIRRMLENAVTLCEDLVLSMGKFTNGLIERKLIKRNTSLPQLYLNDYNKKKRDSGIASEKASSRWSFISEMSARDSTNRLSVFEEECPETKTRRQVSFDLMTPSTSTDVLEEQGQTEDKSLPAETNEKSLPAGTNEMSVPPETNDKSLPADANDNSVSDLKQNVSTVYVHLIPTDPALDISALREELLKISMSLTFRNVQLELVTSDTYVELSSYRHISTSSSEGLKAGRNGLKSSNESPNVLTLNNLSRFAVENSDISDEDNRSIRLISSSDSETSVKRYHIIPVTEKKSVHTQTEWGNGAP